LENTKNVFYIFHKWILEILEKCSEILENTNKDFCIFLGLPKKFFLGGLRPPLPVQPQNNPVGFLGG